MALSAACKETRNTSQTDHAHSARQLRKDDFTAPCGLLQLHRPRHGWGMQPYPPPYQLPQLHHHHHHHHPDPSPTWALPKLSTAPGWQQ